MARIIKFLRWSEKHTGTNMVYLVSNGSWLLLVQGVLSVSGFIVVIILTNLLPKDVFGQYRFMLAIIPILSVFTLPGVDAALMRSVSRGNTVNLITIAKEKIRWGILGSLVALFGSLYYFYKGNELLGYLFILSAIFIPFFESFFIYSVYYKGLQNFKTPAIYEAISRVIQAILIVVVALSTKSILALVATFFVGQIATRLFFYIKTLRSLKRILPNVDDNDDTLEYGKKLSVIGAIGIVAAHIDKLLIWHFLGAEMLAIYVLTLLIPLEIVRVLGLLPDIALPKFAKRDWSLEKERNIFYKKLLGFSIFLAVGSIFYVLIAQNILPIIFPKYPEIVSLTIFITPIIVLSFLRMMFSIVFMAAKKTNYMFFFQTVDLVSYVLLFFSLLILNVNLLAGVVIIFSCKLLIVVTVQILSLKSLKS